MPQYRYHSPLISAEWCAFTNFPWGRGLINFQPHEEAQAMETYHTWPAQSSGLRIGWSKRADCGPSEATQQEKR